MTTAVKRRRLRFGLRTLLLAMTLAAVASWVYWDGWERWQWYRDQQQFLAQAKELKGYPLMSHPWRPALKNYGPPFISENGRHDEKGRYTRYLACGWPNTLYVVFWQLKDSRCSSVEVFRLPAAPRNYQCQTERSRIALRLHERVAGAGQVREEKRPAVSRPANDPTELAYRLDFVEMLSGDRRDELGFEYTLIHSDPPAAERHQ